MKLAVLITLSCVGLATSVQAQNISRDAQDAAAFIEVQGSMEFSGRIIAKPLQLETLADRGLNQQQVADTIARAKAELAKYDEYWFEPLVDHHVINVPNGMTENQFINQLIDTGLFEFVEPDWILYPIACPDDSRLNRQWHHDTDIMMSCEAWDLHTGGPEVTVGICDTGIQTTHPDFQLHRKEGYNAVNRVWENDGGNIGAVHPHGTQTTGCAAANGDNGTGVAGVGWNLSHRMMRVSNSSSGSASLSTLTHAALTSIQAGDRVANVSYSGVTSSSVRSTGTQIKNLGGLLTWAAGNNGANLNWGNRDNDNVIVVGATTSGDNKSSFSAFGPSVDLMAPGSGVQTTNTGSGYASVSGTSFSAPLTAGLIALVWSANPSLTPDEVEAIIKAGADDLGASGIDNTFGYGRINSFNSLLLAGSGNSIDLPFLEEFTSTTFDSDVWGAVAGAEINDNATGEPSEPYAMNLDNSDSATTSFFAMADQPFPRYLSYSVQHQGVEQGELLLLEYLDGNNQWVFYKIILSDGNDQNSFEFHQDTLPADAHHDFFKIRFSATGSDNTDNWYIDDIRIGDEFTPPDDCPADFNGDGSVNSQDVIAFLNAWTAGDESADMNGDGSVNTQDVTLFLNLWNAGC